MSKTPNELSQESPWDGNLDAATHVSDGEKSMGATMRQIIQARGAESVGDIKRGYAAPNSEFWKECVGGTVQAVSYPDYAALEGVGRMSTDGVTGITNLSTNALSLQYPLSSTRIAEMIEHNNTYHLLTHDKNEILTLEKVDDISVAQEGKVTTTRDLTLARSSSIASEMATASGGGVHVLATEYNASEDTIEVEVTSDFVTFDRYTVESNTTTLYASKPWFDDNDASFYIVVTASTTSKLYRSVDLGKTWEQVTTLPFHPYQTGVFSDGARWFEEDGSIYIYPRWQTNKVNYSLTYLNSVRAFGRIKQMGDTLHLFDYNDSSVGSTEYEGGFTLDEKTEFVGGVMDAEIFGGTIVAVNKNGVLYASTDSITYTAIGTLPDAQDSSAIYLHKVDENRCLAIVKIGSTSTAHQFDFVRSPFDLVFLPDIAEQDGLKTWVKVK
ncbi:hypothetical protein KUL70_002499 [Vibrio parahaemolyticus]|nr:hypothetical protein [Vibrio parahaemolyticus]